MFKDDSFASVIMILQVPRIEAKFVSVSDRAEQIAEQNGNQPNSHSHLRMETAATCDAESSDNRLAPDFANQRAVSCADIQATCSRHASRIHGRGCRGWW